MRTVEESSHALISRQRLRRLLGLALTQGRLRESLRTLSQAGLLPPGVWKRLPVETEFRVPLPENKSFLYASVAGDAIGRALFWRGIRDWESETVTLFYQLARNARLVIDVGANTGVFSLLACAANPDLRVVAFEPVPRIFQQLQANTNLNNWQDRCELHCKAVSEVEGRIDFHIPFSTIPTSASLHTKGFRGVRGELVKVEVTTLDAVLTQEDPVDLVKLDVEGFEDKVLKGMRSTLERFRPTLIFECNLEGPVIQIESLLQDFSYDLFHLRPEGAVPVNALLPDPKGKYRNFLASGRGDIRVQL